MRHQRHSLLPDWSAVQSHLQHHCDGPKLRLQQHCGFCTLPPHNRFVSCNFSTCRSLLSFMCSNVFSPLSEPCPPTNVQASILCQQLTANVSWQLSGLAVGYVAYFDNQNGHYASCVGTDTDTMCAVSGLMCGTVYSVWVKALGQRYNSSDSAVVSLISGKEILSIFLGTISAPDLLPFIFFLLFLQLHAFPE